MVSSVQRESEVPHHPHQETSAGRRACPLSESERESIRAEARHNPNAAVLQWLPKRASLEIDDRQRDSVYLIVTTNPVALWTGTLRRLIRVVGKKSVTTHIEKSVPQDDREGFVWGYRDEVRSQTVETDTSMIHAKCYWELHHRGRFARVWPWSSRRFPIGAVMVVILVLSLLGMGLLRVVPSDLMRRLTAGWQ